jgi:beta-galactosidase
LFLAQDATPDIPDSAFETITLPHTNRLFPYHNFGNDEYQFISTYRKHFRLPEPLNGRRLFIDFEGAMIASEVFLNGRKLGEYEGGFTPFSFDLTDYLRPDGDNLLTVRLDSTERPDIPPYGNVVDYLTFGGIYRDVHLRYVEPCHIADVVVRPTRVLEPQPRLHVDVKLVNLPGTALSLKTSLLDAAGAVLVESTRPVNAPPGDSLLLDDEQLHNLPPLKLWTLDEPTLYHLRVQLWMGDTLIDEQTERFGFREAHFDKDGSFYLNGQPLKLRGLNRHQTYPYIGAAAPARLQRKDAEIVKYELGCNIVRTSHYPQSKHFLRRCDEIGLLVFEEIPGWQHIGDRDWQGIALRDVEAMIVRDRNHPSIILWGVRINESQDNTALYKATNELAHKLDPTRQTGGVRYFLDSEFLEDVFTFNDFSNGVQEPKYTPHLITEFMGHMFPTKTWDAEDRLVEHAIRHTRVQDLARQNPRVSGAIGWCMADYNTHPEFGGGDRICYHGVLDIFRLPKFAAYLYESQIDPETRIVMRPATSYGFGDRNNYGAESLQDFYVFSNVDEIEAYAGEDKLGRYKPDRENFPGLAHPPFRIGTGQLWFNYGLRVPDARLIGYRNGQPVIEDKLAVNKLPHTLTLQPDDAELIADGADMTRVVFKILDKFEHVLPYSVSVVYLEVTGPADLIGDNPFPLVGGQAAVYLKAQKETGVVTITARVNRLPPATATVRITPRA